MKLHIEKDSPIPVGTQIKERIRIGLSFGELKAGDTLPSIRDLEAETGTGRAIIRKAYLELQEQGILEISQGRRVSVSESIVTRKHETGLKKKLDGFTQETLQKAAELQVNEVSLARYLLSRAMDQSRESQQLVFVDRSKYVADKVATAISGLWDLPVSPVMLENLKDVLKQKSNGTRKILTSYYRLGEVLTLVKKLKLEREIDVIPTGWVMGERMRVRMRKIAKGSTVLLITEENDYKRNGQAFAEIFEKDFADRDLSFVVAPKTGEQTVVDALDSPEYAQIILSNHLWDILPEEQKKHRKMMHPEFDVSMPSLEAARVKIGILQ
jgi:DNA-binding transcriptional regulator YhcF (GntR family)